MTPYFMLKPLKNGLDLEKTQKNVRKLFKPYTRTYGIHERQIK